MKHRRRLGALLATLAVGSACASMGSPPGGPPDKLPPVLVSITPDSGALRVSRNQVLTFRFDEVINERLKSGGPLDQGVVVSPSEGPVSVDWHRTYLTIRNRKGWRPDIAYTVTILSGLQDLTGNGTRKALQTVFSTGSVIPHGAVSGVAFDWIGQRSVSGARVEAMIGNDTVLKFVATADSLGRFLLPNLPSGVMRVRAFVDANNNRVLDPRELWDSVSVTLADTASRELYMFAHDTIGPAIADITPVDSVTLRVRFDRPLLPGAPLDSAQFSLKTKDSTQADSVSIPIRRVASAARFDTLAQQRKLASQDSILRADTSDAGKKAIVRRDSLNRMRIQDSISAAQVASVKAARDTVKRVEAPKPQRPAPLLEFIVELAQPLGYDRFANLSVRDAIGLTGHTRKPARPKQFVRRKPVVPDSLSVSPKKPGAKPDSSVAVPKKP